MEPLVATPISNGDKKKKTNRADCDAGVSKEEKLVETGYKDGPEEPNRPRAKSVHGHLHVVRVGDGGPHFGIRRLILPLWWTEEEEEEAQGRTRRGEAASGIIKRRCE